MERIGDEEEKQSRRVMRTDKNHAGNVSPPRNTILDLGKRFVRSTASWKIVPTDRGKERKRRYVISDYSISVPPPPVLEATVSEQSGRTIKSMAVVSRSSVNSCRVPPFLDVSSMGGDSFEKLTAANAISFREWGKSRTRVAEMRVETK